MLIADGYWCRLGPIDLRMPPWPGRAMWPWHVARGMAVLCGPWHVARGMWPVARGPWHVARRPWPVARGMQPVACAPWHVARRPWHVACGPWHVARHVVRGMQPVCWSRTRLELPAYPLKRTLSDQQSYDISVCYTYALLHFHIRHVARGD